MLITLSEWFSVARGKLCMHSNKYVSLRHGQLYSGTICEPRDLSQRPYTDDEIAHQAAFKTASSLRKLILDSDTLKPVWQERFRADLKAKATACSTLSGYLMSQALHGHISAEGAYQDAPPEAEP